MLDLHALVHHDVEPALGSDVGSLLADHPELQPQALGTDRDRFLGNTRRCLRIAEHVHGIDRLCNIAQRWVRFLAENRGFARIDRDDIVAVDLQVAADEIARA